MVKSLFSTVSSKIFVPKFFVSGWNLKLREHYKFPTIYMYFGNIPVNINRGFPSGIHSWEVYISLNILCYTKTLNNIRMETIRRRPRGRPKVQSLDMTMAKWTSCAKRPHYRNVCVTSE